MSNDAAERVRELLIADASLAYCRFGNAVTSGFWSMTGREVPVVVVEGASPGTVRLGDAGEAWFELVSEGICNPSPSQRDRERVERLCEHYGVSWDHRAREIYVDCPIQESPGWVRKIISATIALDGWRILHPVDKAVTRLSRQEIVDGVVEVARRKGIQVDPKGYVVGVSGNPWSADAVFRGEREKVVGVHVLEENVPSFTERAIGWSYDTKAPMVVVASKMKADRIRDMQSLQWNSKIRAISRASDHLSEQVVNEVAEALAA